MVFRDRRGDNTKYTLPSYTVSYCKKGNCLLPITISQAKRCRSVVAVLTYTTAPPVRSVRQTETFPRRKLDPRFWKSFPDSYELTGQLLGESYIRYVLRGKLLSQEGLLQCYSTVAAQKMSRALWNLFLFQPPHCRAERQWLWPKVGCNNQLQWHFASAGPGTRIKRCPAISTPSTSAGVARHARFRV